MASLVEKVVAAIEAVDAKFHDQVSTGQELSAYQQAEKMIAVVQAIVGGDEPEPEEDADDHPSKKKRR